MNDPNVEAIKIKLARRRGRQMRETVTLLDGTVLRVNDPCRVQIGNCWRVGVIAEIMQGSGVDRAWVTLRDGVKIGPLSRYGGLRGKAPADAAEGQK